MKIADGLAVLKLNMSFEPEQKRLIYPALIWDENMVVLCDTGVPGLTAEIQKEMALVDIPFARLQKVIITHQDIDHIGSLPDLLQKSGGKIVVLAHSEEKPYIEGKKPLIKFNPENMGRLLASLPEEQRQRMAAVFTNPPKAPVDRTVSDGELLPYCGGITVIFTPGHTPGHICLYLNRNKTLISGDALNVVDGILHGPNPRATADMKTAVQSIEKLTHYDIETVICYHGGVYNTDVNRRLKELAQEQL